MKYVNTVLEPVARRTPARRGRIDYREAFHHRGDKTDCCRESHKGPEQVAGTETPPALLLSRAARRSQREFARPPADLVQSASLQKRYTNTSLIFPLLSCLLINETAGCVRFSCFCFDYTASTRRRNCVQPHFQHTVFRNLSCDKNSVKLSFSITAVFLKHQQL